MTDAELIELSLRARLAIVQNNDLLAFFRVRATRLFDDYRVSSNFEHLLMISRNDKQFFWHRDHLGEIKKPDPPPRIKDIKCTNNEWASALLCKLRAMQVLDQLAWIE